jgi:hypothetical protein
MEILGVEKFGAALFQLFRAGQRLAFGAVAVGTGNGEIPITCFGLNRSAVFAQHQRFNAKSSRCRVWLLPSSENF